MSASLRLQGASFTYDGVRPILDNVHLHLTPGWTGLVGHNGAGKSTLLAALAGELPGVQPRYAPVESIVLRLEQRVDRPSQAVRALHASWDGEAARIKSRLDLVWDALERWPTLSPGERRRWQVGAALWRRPDVLLLDEPDNHLDVETRGSLVGALREHPGIGVIISHDRALLDALTTKTVRLRNGHVSVVDGPWSAADAVWQAEARAAQEQLDRAQATARTAQHVARTAADRQASASRGRSMRGVDVRDHDARSLVRKGRAAKAEASHAATARRLQAVAGRARSEAEDLERPTDLGRSVQVPYVAPRRRTLFALQTPELRPAPRVEPVLHDIDLTVAPGDRVWVCGPNGVGKSTLLRALVQASPLSPEQRLVLPQELTPADEAALVERLHRLPPEDRGRVLQLVAALGVDPARLLRTPRPSPGEARKLALALGLGTAMHALVLDEPTHHLDLAARQRLQAALARFPGALLLISHDRMLARAVCTVRWSLQEGRVHVEGWRRGPTAG